MPRKNHLIVDSGCTQDNERWSLSACGLNEESEVAWDGTHSREFVSCKRCLAKMAKPRPAPEPFNKERPILFNGAMARAILAGKKTVTRRPIKGNQIPSRSKSDSPEHQWISVVQDHPRWGFAAFGATEEECAAELAKYGGCPYGRQGDRLWVRETTEADEDCSDVVVLSRYVADGAPVVYSGCSDPEYNGTVAHWDYSRRSRPSIHMQRWACRILLEITDVRVERLKDISEQQALAEGIYSDPAVNGMYTYDGDHYTSKSDGPDRAFAELWNTTGGDWDANPWVWVVEFKRVTP